MFDLLMLPIIAMFFVMFVVMANVPLKIDKFLNRKHRRENTCIFGIRYFYRKPFNCELCLTFWISLIYLLFLRQNVFNAVMLAGATAYLTSPLKRLL
jgi:hypothetical protein